MKWNNLLAENCINRTNEINGTWFLGENTPAATFYLRANESCEKFIKYVFFIVNGSFVLVTFLFAGIGAIFYYVRDGYVEASNLYVPLRLRSSILVSLFENLLSIWIQIIRFSTPFDHNTAGGWLCIIFYEFVVSLPYSSLNILIASFFLSYGLFFEAFYLHFQSIFSYLDEIIRSGSNQTFVHRTDLRCKAALVEAIQLHSNAKT